MVESAKVHCSWCLYNVFIPISDKLVKCYNCETLKCIDEGIEVEPKFEEWDIDY